MGYHDLARDSSGAPKLLSDVGGGFAAASDLLIRLHGALMLASWIGTASVGMLLARYYRQTWVNSQLFGKDQWFAVRFDFLLFHLNFIVIFLSDYCRCVTEFCYTRLSNMVEVMVRALLLAFFRCRK